MTDTYSPGVRALLDDPAQIPPELTLFFHNKRWTDPVPPYGGVGSASAVPLFQRIRNRHSAALDDVRGFVASWGALQAGMASAGDAVRWAGIKVRLDQQLNDAVVFSEVILGYYEELQDGGLRA